jgi:3-oxoacyl-[acyl-carrier-protein] synthase-3
VVFNCSVTRDYFEPATGVIVHQNLGLPETVMAMDITNACVGFSNGMFMLANLIESGVVKAGIVTTGENLGPITEATINQMIAREDMGREELLRMMPTFTLGSGAVAAVLCHSSIASTSHRLIGSVCRSASQFSDLCVGNGDFCYLQQIGLNPIMTTDSQKLISSAAKLGARTWEVMQELVGWSADDVDHIFCHQVGKQVNRSFYEVQGLDIEKEFTVYQDYGNLVSAALPSALFTAAEQGLMEEGDKLLLTGYGSGLNSIFSGIVW